MLSHCALTHPYCFTICCIFITLPSMNFPLAWHSQNNRKKLKHLTILHYEDINISCINVTARMSVHLSIWLPFLFLSFFFFFSPQAFASLLIHGTVNRRKGSRHLQAICLITHWQQSGFLMPKNQPNTSLINKKLTLHQSSNFFYNSFFFLSFVSLLMRNSI